MGTGPAPGELLVAGGQRADTGPHEGYLSVHLSTDLQVTAAVGRGAGPLLSKHPLPPRILTELVPGGSGDKGHSNTVLAWRSSQPDGEADTEPTQCRAERA